MGFKRRKWMAYLQVSASGPEFSSVLENGGRFYRPRMAADLRYTTADVDFLESHFARIDNDSSPVEFHQRLINPTCEEFFTALEEIKVWLAQFKNNLDWDGGGFQLCFAGHGCEGAGDLVLEDGAVSPTLFLATLAGISHQVSLPERLRVSLVLDSCHSGAFATEVLERSLNEDILSLVPYHIFASCMDDEYAWEDSSLGHGLYTYCFSVQSSSLGSLSAAAIQPNNTFGPSLAIASGEMGCSLLSGGAQNPIAYWNGAGYIDTCGQTIEIYDDGKCMDLSEMRRRLKLERDKILEAIKLISKISFNKTNNSSDEELRKTIQKEIEFIRAQKKI